MNKARQEIFERIHSANRTVPTSQLESEYAQIERSYRLTGILDQAAVIDLFIDRLHDYGSGVYRCPETAIAAAIASLLHARGINEMLVSAGVPAQWRPQGFQFREDLDLTYEALDAAPGVLTGCAAAIALTGSIILSHTKERRALTLIPDYHLCVVFEDQVAETVPEAIRQLAAFGNAPITTIAGPSATADIEMTRIKGVHGPRSLDVILAGR